MILDTPVRSLRIVLGEAHTTTACDIVACFGQQSATGTFITALSQVASTGTTPVTIVAAPLLGTQNLVQEVRLHNSDTVTHTVVLQLLDNATTRTVYSGTVLPGADWVYTPGAGTAGTIPLASTSTPIMDGVAAAGVSTAWSRGDHIHPIDTSRAPLAGPTFTGTVTAGNTNVGAFTALGITASPISGSTGSFTTLAASSTVSGVGFSVYLASPPAIGATVAGTGKFTTLQSTGNFAVNGSTPVAQPTITGSRGGATVTVLADLLTALAGAGLIIDSTTA